MTLIDHNEKNNLYTRYKSKFKGINFSWTKASSWPNKNREAGPQHLNFSCTSRLRYDDLVTGPHKRATNMNNLNIETTTSKSQTIKQAAWLKTINTSALLSATILSWNIYDLENEI